MAHRYKFTQHHTVENPVRFRATLMQDTYFLFNNSTILFVCKDFRAAFKVRGRTQWYLFGNAAIYLQNQQRPPSVDSSKFTTARNWRVEDSSPKTTKSPNKGFLFCKARCGSRTERHPASAQFYIINPIMSDLRLWTKIFTRTMIAFWFGRGAVLAPAFVASRCQIPPPANSIYLPTGRGKHLWGGAEWGQAQGQPLQKTTLTCWRCFAISNRARRNICKISN